MVDYKKYMVQVLKLLINNKNSDNSMENYDKLFALYKILEDKQNTDATVEDFEKLFLLYKGEELPDDKDEILKRVNSIIGNMSFEFLESPLGQVWGYLKFMDQEMTLKEAADLLSVKIQYMQQIRTKLITRKSAGIWLVRESSFNDWLLKSGRKSLKELKKERREKTMFYEAEAERIYIPEEENEDTYK